MYVVHPTRNVILQDNKFSFYANIFKDSIKSQYNKIYPVLYMAIFS